MAELIELLKFMIERQASDLHVSTGTAPRIRLSGKLVPVDYRSLSPEDTKELCYSMMTESQIAKYETHCEVDLSFGIKGLSRFRANIFQQRGAVAGTFREIPFAIKGLSELGLPGVVDELLGKTRGLVLVTGPAGSGKSTTLASMIERINTEREAHIITIEDPIEFLHSHNKCIINQRELHSDTPTFATALKHAMRQDPDIVMISELRDLQSVEASLTISETGHLTFAAMHTTSAIQTVNRIIELFPPHHQEHARSLLAEALEGIISQKLVKRKDGNGRVLAAEVMIPTPAIRTLIKENRAPQIYPIMQTARNGMRTMNQSLTDLYQKGIISYDDALNNSSLPEELVAKLGKEKT